MITIWAQILFEMLNVLNHIKKCVHFIYHLNNMMLVSGTHMTIHRSRNMNDFDHRLWHQVQFKRYTELKLKSSSGGSQTFDFWTSSTSRRLVRVNRRFRGHDVSWESTHETRREVWRVRSVRAKSGAPTCFLFSLCVNMNTHGSRKNNSIKSSTWVDVIWFYRSLLISWTFRVLIVKYHSWKRNPL